METARLVHLDRHRPVSHDGNEEALVRLCRSVLLVVNRAERNLEREHGLVSPLSLQHTGHANELWHTADLVFPEPRVVLLLERRGHEHVHVLPQSLVLSKADTTLTPSQNGTRATYPDIAKHVLRRRVVVDDLANVICHDNTVDDPAFQLGI